MVSGREVEFMKPAERKLIEQYATSRYFDESPLADRMQLDGRSIFDAIPKPTRDCIDRVVSRIERWDFPGLSPGVFKQVFWRRYLGQR